MAASVRLATEADLPQLIPLLDQLSLDGPREDIGPPLPEKYGRAFRRIQDAGQRLFVLEDSGRIIGSLVLVVVPNLSHNTAPYAIIENVVVESTRRSQGHGEQLIRHAVEEARRAGCYKVALTSSKRRPDAHRFYQRLGFTATHEGFRIDL